MKKTLLWGAGLTLLFAIACEKNNEEGKTYQNVTMDITNADMLVLYQDGQDKVKSTATVSDNHSNLYKLTAQGLERVIFSAEDDKPIEEEETEVFVENIVPLGDQIILFQGNFRFGETEYWQILVRKSDGAIFDFSGIHLNHMSTDLTLNGSPFQRDGNERYYFKGDIVTHDDNSDGTPSATVDEHALIRMTITNIENPTYEDIQPAGQLFHKFTVDNNGNVYYMEESSPSPELKVIKNTGGILLLEDQHVSIPWKGVNGHVYTFIGNDIYKLEVQEEEVIKTKVWENPDQDFGSGYSTYGFRVDKSNSVLFISSDGSENGSSSTDMIGKSWEFNETTHSLTEVEVPLNPGKIVQTDEYVYMYGGNKLYKMQNSNNVFTDISSGEYEFYTFGAGNDNELVFSALRYSDGKKVTGRLTTTDQLEIIDEESDREATYMIRLN